MIITTPEYTTSENPAIELFQKLGYEYFNASEFDPRLSISEVVLQDRLLTAIQRINPWINENNLKKAYKAITSINASSLIEANEHIHKLLINSNDSKFSVSQVIDGREQSKTPAFIDFNNIENNDFLVVNQMKFKGRERNSIPDLVVFVNGLPLAVIECKSSTRLDACDEAISDLSYYQRNSEKLFFYNQICAGIYRVGGKYAAIGAKPIHYQVYKSEDNKELEAVNGENIIAQDILLYNLFEKNRFLDIIRNFIIFETEEGVKIKKLPRYQQIRATNKTIDKLKNEDKGGVVWHTQGSGKSITMIYLATKLRREENGFNNPTIIVMTDRIELDDQISKTFQRCGFPNPLQAASVNHLRTLLKDSYGKTIFSTIYKFLESKEDEQGNRIRAKDIKPEDIEILSEKENIYVLIDEAHRTQYGPLATIMRTALPNAKFIAFTGTPLSSAEKSTLGKFYGGKYIDTYTIKESVEDEATLPILYEDGLPDCYVEKELLDKQFDLIFGDESEEKQDLLKKEGSSIGKFMTAEQRVKRVAEHVIDHYKTKIYPDGFKAMLVCYNRYQAVAYKKAFDELSESGVNPFKSKIVMSYNPKHDEGKIDYKMATPEDQIKAARDNFKLPFGDEDSLSKGGKKQFDNTAILIVSDMLLTGYDAPIVQVMYLDKLLKEHNLLQAIARVNRTRSGKEAGYIVDYCGITEHLVEALKIFSGDLDPSDIMENSKEEQGRLERRHAQLVAFFNPISIDRKADRQNYIDKSVAYLESEELRDEFKELIKRFNKSMNIVMPDTFAAKFIYDFYVYNDIKLTARNVYVDESLKITAEDSKKLQKLIDEHLRATGIQNLLSEPVSIIDREKFEAEIMGTMSDKSKELKMIYRIKHTIKVELDKNPEFYKPLAERLEELIELRRQERITQLSFLKELEEIQNKIVNKNQEAQSLGFNSERDFAVYKTLEHKIEGDSKFITTLIFKALENELDIIEWQNKEQIKKEMRKKIKEIIRGKVPAEELQSLSRTIVEQLKKF